MPHPAVLLLSADSRRSAELTQLLETHALRGRVHSLGTRAELHQALTQQLVAAVIYEGGPLSLADALRVARVSAPAASFVVVGDAGAFRSDAALADVDEVLAKDSPRLLPVLKQALRRSDALADAVRLRRRERAWGHLVAAVQQLSLARDLTQIYAIVRRAAREITAAQGAAFVLRNEDRCFYVDVDAIAPLWMGQQFPASSCISGWVMIHREPAVIDDVFADPRIQSSYYCGTFVKSLLMVPIRVEDPIGAIGVYWADRHVAEPDELEMLQTLANSSCVAIENARLYADLDARVRQRTRLLEETNRELEAYAYSVSHDLRSPLSVILGYADLIKEALGPDLPRDVQHGCERIVQQTQRMNGLIGDLLRLAKISRAELNLRPLDLTQLARESLSRVINPDEHRVVQVRVAEGLSAEGDPELIQIVVENLISNAWKYTGKTLETRIEIGCLEQTPEGPVFFVRDNGAGFNPHQAGRLFAPFQRLHRSDEFPGVGVGLATVQRIIHKHGGRIWADASVGAGATFYFTLPPPRLATLDAAETPLPSSAAFMRGSVVALSS